MIAYFTPERRLAAALGPNVQFRWTGQPRQGFLLRGRDIFLIPFTAMWFGFALFWEAMAWYGPAPLFFRLWGIPFICVGLYIFAGRFFVDRYLRAHTAYGVSDTGAYIVRDGIRPSVVVYDAASISPIRMQQNPDGSGTLTFGSQSPLMWFYGWDAWQVGNTNGFIGIPHVADVFQLVQNLKKQ